MSAATTAPAVALGMYDSVNKRDNWKSYAKNGDIFALHELGESYCCRPFEGEISFKESVKWFCEGAKAGNAKSQVELGNIFEGIKKTNTSYPKVSDEAALAMYILASDRMSEEGRKLRDETEKRLDGQGISNAYHMANTIGKMDCAKISEKF
jgi:TPR repeat protein